MSAIRYISNPQNEEIKIPKTEVETQKIEEKKTTETPVKRKSTPVVPLTKSEERDLKRKQRQEQKEKEKTNGL